MGFFVEKIIRSLRKICARHATPGTDRAVNTKPSWTIINSCILRSESKELRGGPGASGVWNEWKTWTVHMRDTLLVFLYPNIKLRR